jgi:hypothetical protein
MTPAEVLREAAKRIREVAGKATPGRWLNLDRGDRIISEPDAGGDFEYVLDEPLEANRDNGEHIAMWQPSVALLVADELEQQAEGWDDHSELEQLFVAAPNGPDDTATAAPIYLLALAINAAVSDAV